jgi:hypothetical protein
MQLIKGILSGESGGLKRGSNNYIGTWCQYSMSLKTPQKPTPHFPAPPPRDYSPSVRGGKFLGNFPSHTTQQQSVALGTPRE